MGLYVDTRAFVARATVRLAHLPPDQPPSPIGDPTPDPVGDPPLPISPDPVPQPEPGPPPQIPPPPGIPRENQAKLQHTGH